MPLNTVPLPYGCRDVKIYTLTAGTDAFAATGIDLPNARTFQFTENEDFTELRGDDALKATHGKGPSVAWTLENGGISLEAVVAMYGGTIVTTGTTPAQVKTFKANGSKVRPYFGVWGQAISDSGGDFQVKVYKCKANGDLTGELGDGNFWLTGARGVGLPNATNDLYDFIQNETAVALL